MLPFNCRRCGASGRTPEPIYGSVCSECAGVCWGCGERIDGLADNWNNGFWHSHCRIAAESELHVRVYGGVLHSCKRIARPLDEDSDKLYYCGHCKVAFPAVPVEGLWLKDGRWRKN